MRISRTWRPTRSSLEVPAPANGDRARDPRAKWRGGYQRPGARASSRRVPARPLLRNPWPRLPLLPRPSGAGRSAPAASADEGKDGRLSPSVRRLVEENQLNPAAIPASGRDGRLTKSDVVGLPRQEARRGAPPPAVAARSVGAGADGARPSLPRRLARRARSEQRVAMTLAAGAHCAAPASRRSPRRRC